MRWVSRQRYLPTYCDNKDDPANHKHTRMRGEALDSPSYLKPSATEKMMTKKIPRRISLAMCMILLMT